MEEKDDANDRKDEAVSYAKTMKMPIMSSLMVRCIRSRRIVALLVRRFIQRDRHKPNNYQTNIEPSRVASLKPKIESFFRQQNFIGFTSLPAQKNIF